jgi:hypothetical protein
MKIKQIASILVTILFGFTVSQAEDTSSGLATNVGVNAKDANITWSAPTNGVRAGIKIISAESWGTNNSPVAPLSNICFQNIGTNSILFRVRYKAELYGPDGNLIPSKPGQEIPVHNKHKITSPHPQETAVIDFFSVPEVFQIQTNGTHQLIILMQAATNAWHGRLTYFDLPSVTNYFRIDSK